MQAVEATAPSRLSFTFIGVAHRICDVAIYSRVQEGNVEKREAAPEGGRRAKHTSPRTFVEGRGAPVERITASADSGVGIATAGL